MPEAQKRPNIVFIVADQWRGDCLGCAPGRHPVMTPHVNQLAAEGARFAHAFADCPTCMPQRVTQLTGQVASRFGLTSNFACRTPIDPARSLPGRLTREAGYQGQAVGKMHFVPSRGRFGFENVALHPNDYVRFLEDAGYGGMYRGHGLGGNEVYPAVSAVPERYTHTHWVVDEAVRFLGRRDPDAPFFLWMVFEAPHSPFDPPAPYDRMYENFTIPEPLRAAWLDGPDAPPYFRRKRLIHKYDQLSDEAIRETRRRYYGQISHIDYQLGRLLGELKTRGLYDDTAIVFTADHGEHLGDHGVFAKTTFVRGSGDVPLIFRPPAGFRQDRPGRVVDSPALTADVVPTLLELAGLARDDECDGVSMLAALASSDDPAGRVVCGECGQTAFATDGRFKYVYYADGGVEHLFDMAADPDDLLNVAGRDGNCAILGTLRDALVAHLARFDRPMVQDGELTATHEPIDEDALRARNPCAWRGPMRGGQGYDGWEG